MFRLEKFTSKLVGARLDRALIRKFQRDENGLVVVEYVIGAAGLLILVGILFASFGTALLSKLSSILYSL